MKKVHPLCRENQHTSCKLINLHISQDYMNTVITSIGSIVNCNGINKRFNQQREYTLCLQGANFTWTTNSQARKGIILRSSKRFEELKLRFETWWHLTVRLPLTLCIKHGKRMKRSPNEMTSNQYFNLHLHFKCCFLHSVPDSCAHRKPLASSSECHLYCSNKQIVLGALQE